MLMMTVTDVMKMNRDFLMFCNAEPINLLCLSVHPRIYLNPRSQWMDFDEFDAVLLEILRLPFKA
jgi:hypothetical protein